MFFHRKQNSFSIIICGSMLNVNMNNYRVHIIHALCIVHNAYLIFIFNFPFASFILLVSSFLCFFYCFAVFVFLNFTEYVCLLLFIQCLLDTYNSKNQEKKFVYPCEDIRTSDYKKKKNQKAAASRVRFYAAYYLLFA